MVAGTVTLGSIVILFLTLLPPKTMIRSISRSRSPCYRPAPLIVTTIDLDRRRRGPTDLRHLGHVDRIRADDLCRRRASTTRAGPITWSRPRCSTFDAQRERAGLLTVVAGVACGPVAVT